MDSLKLYLDNTSTLVSGSLKGDQYKAFKKVLGYQPEDYLWRAQNNPNWDGYISCVCYSKTYCKCAIKKDGMHFPTGLISKALEFFRANGITYELFDVRDDVVKNSIREIDYGISTHFSNGKPLKLHDYQSDAVSKAISQQRGILSMCTGAGKTLTAAAIIAELGVKRTIFYVTSIDLLKQAISDFTEYLRLNGSLLSVGAVGGGQKRIDDITVMTIQTAVKALGGNYKKYDDEDGVDNTDIGDIKAQIVDLIQSAKLVFFDECHHVSSESCQIVANNSLSARWRFGLSATPYRDKGDDILIDACFGKPIININASQLIEQGYLVRPTIAFLKIDNMKGERLGAYPSVYKSAIVENDYRNSVIANLALNLKEQGRTTLVLVQQIAHGMALQDIIPNSIFLHGSCTKKERESHLHSMRQGCAPVTIASSLPYEELLLVKINGLIRQIEIGDLCHNYDEPVKNGSIDALCSKDGKTLDWSKVTGLHIHKRENRLVRVQTNKNEDTTVTENHSLVDSNLNQVLPCEGKPACSPQGMSKIVETLTEINVIKTLSNCDFDGAEVVVHGINQGQIRKLKSELKYFRNRKSVCKCTRLRICKQTFNQPDEYFLAIEELLSYSRYYKYRRRMKISNAAKCKYLFNFFEGRVYVRRLCNPAWLPVKLPITNDLATFFGLMAAEGYFGGNNIYTSPKRVRPYDCVFTAKIGNTVDGKYDKDKQSIRDIFKRSFETAFPLHKLSFTDKQIKCSSKLIYLLCRELGCFDTLKEKRIPDFIYNVNKIAKEHFLWGHYLGDGSQKFHNEKMSSYAFHTSSRPLMHGIWSLLQMLNHSFNIVYREASSNIKARYSLISRSPLLHLVPNVQVVGRDYSDSRRIQKKVEYLDRHDTLVYDISVDDCHNFMGGTVLDHNTIFDEGVDVKPLDSLILAGGGRSSTRALQRIGRIIRNYTYPDGRKKEDAFVYDFHDVQKYLTQHSVARRKIYRTEPEFVIQDFDL